MPTSLLSVEVFQHFFWTNIWSFPLGSCGVFDNFCQAAPSPGGRKKWGLGENDHLGVLSIERIGNGIFMGIFLWR